MMIKMNPQEANDVNPIDDLGEDDLGIFIFSDSENRTDFTI